jgi:energy-coupling factor transporter ATP-binding protein EcfA2
VAERASANRDRFLAVLGPSGAGKSSVVMAGLIPALKRGEIPGSQHWTYIPRIVPGARPLESLADALYALMPTKSLASIETDLSSPGGRYLHRLVNQLPGDYVLLYIDQFEEVFHATPDEAQRQRFINLITHAVTEPDGKLLVL